MSGAASLLATGLRGRVERLLRGDIRQDEIHELIFNMRGESRSRGFVSEIGNFLAHPIIRTQGIVTQESRDMYAIWKLHSWLDTSRIITKDIPDWIPDAIFGNLRRMRPSDLKRKTGLSRAQAKQVLQR